MRWPTDIHNAYFVTLLYQRISFVIGQYADQMTEEVIDELSSMDTLPNESKAYTKINNLYTVLKKMDDLFRDDVLHAFSSLIRNQGAHRRTPSTNGRTNGQGRSDRDHLWELRNIQTGRLVSIKVIKAENVENKETGEPLNSFVRLTGALENRTRTIGNDAYPEWNEDFETVLLEGETDIVQLRIFAETGRNMTTIVEQFPFQLTFDSRKDGVVQQITQESHGVNLYIEYKFENIKHDPIFYNGQVRTSLENAIQRIIKLLGSRTTKQIMETLTKQNIRNVCKESPDFPRVDKFFLSEEDDPDYEMLDPAVINDAMIVGLCNTINTTVNVLSMNLEEDAIDELLVYMWSVTLSTGINAVLPPLAITGSVRMRKLRQQQQSQRSNILERITTQLGSLGLDTDGSESMSYDEMERMISWMYKIFYLIGDLLHEQYQDQLITKEMVNIRDLQILYEYDYQELQTSYESVLAECKQLMESELQRPANRIGGVLSRSDSVMARGTVQDRQEYEEQVDNSATVVFLSRELVLRVMLAKEGAVALDFVDTKTREFDEYSKNLKNKIIARSIINRG
ncbi:unnamed protein product [Ambrosiozyma monospora]|uniref:Unnamed protein product n=1 Tax=Ambrosiozyma monospora TaxID=43982 RepID=A0ACB5T9X2_AMBMO|nr:unnamed protein product [Ambrosiozyma monospora]